MHRLSSSLFMIALILCYCAKIFKSNRGYLIKSHITIGWVSIILMILSMIPKVISEDIIKYTIFILIMAAIGVTGYLIKKKGKLYKQLHIVSTISFFIYLFISIKYL